MIHKPNHIVNYQIYDIFYTTKLIIIRPAESDLDIYVNDKKCSIYRCPHHHTFIYTVSIPFTPTISLRINNQVMNTHVNRYPDFKDEIIMATLVKEEDNYIKQWIDFHLHLGITRFIIYDNSTSNTLHTFLSEYIKKNQVILIQWVVPYELPKSGISGQTTQQNHSIYAFYQSKYIGLFDIDEYVNIQNHTNIHTFFKYIIETYTINTSLIGSFAIKNKFFYNPLEECTEGTKFLNIVNCDQISKGREKNFVVPKNIKTFSVHEVTDGKPMVLIDEFHIYFNHYIFLNKKDRGTTKTPWIDDSILRHIK